jgi:phospholipase/carboxylesterase
MSPLDRRQFLAAAAGAASAIMGCASGRSPEPGGPSDARTLSRSHEKGRLSARPAPPSEPPPGKPGVTPIGLGSERDGVIYAPAGYTPARPAPLVVMLHGAGGSARRGLPRLQVLADAYGLLLLAVDSRASTWDAVSGGFGPDAQFIDAALARVFAGYAVDPARIAVEGFSDGASYALGLGLTNGDLFTHTIAFSPGSLPLQERNGAPAVFISHGTADQVLPIDMCSRRIVPELKRHDYVVRYVEFAGDHRVPPEIAEQAVGWFLN